MNFFHAMFFAIIFLAPVSWSEDHTDNKCSFDSPSSEEWSIKNNINNTIVRYYYLINKKKENAELEINCMDSDLDSALKDDYEKTDAGWIFQGGVQGQAVTKEIFGKNWHGVQTKYVQNNSCLLTIGASDEHHAFRSEICDSEKDIRTQINVLNKMFKKSTIN